MNYPKNRYTGEKPWMDKDWLYEEYVVKDKGTQDIADEYGCKQNTIQQWLCRHKIKKPVVTKKRRIKPQYYERDYLYEQHILLGKSVQEIADDNNVSYDTISLHLARNGIEKVKCNPHKKYNDVDIDKMIKLYCDDKMSANKIADIFDTSHNVIIKALKRNGIDTRDMSESQFALNNKPIPDDFYNADLLQKLHWEDKKTCKEIGDIFGVEAGTIRRQMHRLGLQTKNNAESKVGLMTGDKHPNWKGGLTPLSLLLREYFHTNQVPVIAKRDNYKCQLCGASHTILHVHHIKRFSEIVDEICKEHSNLNPDDEQDRLKLYNIIVKDPRFLDENNLITFCKDCHLYKIHNYTKHKTISSQA